MIQAIPPAEDPAPLSSRPMSKRTRNLYRWKERSPDGRKREIEAQLFGAQWTIQSRFMDEEEWTVHERAPLDDLMELEKKVFNKYQRKHNAWDQVLMVRKLIQDHPEYEPDEDDEDE